MRRLWRVDRRFATDLPSVPTLPCLPCLLAGNRTTWTERCRAARPGLSRRGGRGERDGIESPKSGWVHLYSIRLGGQFQVLSRVARTSTRASCGFAAAVAADGESSSADVAVGPRLAESSSQRRPPGHCEFSAGGFSQSSPGAEAKGSSNEEVEREEPEEPMVAPKS